MIKNVLDASAILAVLNGERGEKKVVPLLNESAVSSVNVTEVAAKLMEAGVDEKSARFAVSVLGVAEFADFTEESACLRRESKGKLIGTVNGQAISANDLILMIDNDSPFMPPLEGEPVRVLPRNTFGFIGNGREFACLPIRFCLFDSLLGTRNEIPPDKPLFADWRAAEQKQMRPFRRGG